MNKMPNKVFLEGDIVHNVFEGDQTERSVYTVVYENRKFAEELRKQGKKVLMMSDLTNLGASTAGSRKASTDALQKMDYDKVALFGANKFMKHLANLIVFGSGMSHKVRYFDTKEQAEEWLRE